MASSVTRNNELFPLVVAGDAAARSALIEENMALVVVKADSLIKQMPSIAYLRDDLVSAGYIGLVKAINRLPSGKVRMKALNTWIGRCVLRVLLQLLPKERTIRVPRSSADAARNPESVSWDAQPIDAPVVYNVLPETLRAHSHLPLVDLQDICEACCHTDTERECLRLRAAGYTFREIGTTLDLPLATANLMFRNLQKRILHKWDCQ
jgi:DNA-directed RNA polymerase specialized sigma24 family protein